MCQKKSYHKFNIAGFSNIQIQYDLGWALSVAKTTVSNNLNIWNNNRKYLDSNI